MLKNYDGSWNKDMLFKILFAIEIAMMPMLLAGHLLMPKWAIITIMIVIICAKLFMILLKDSAYKNHIYLDSIGNVIVICLALIIYACFDYLNLALAIFTCFAVVLEEILKVYFYFKPNKQYVDALNFACEMFMYLVLGGMLVAMTSITLLKLATIGLLVLCIAIIILQGYNFFYYYVFKKEKPRTIRKKK